MGDYRKSLGEEGEAIAQRYLEKKGYRIIEKHYQKREGEIDLIAYDGDELVFIEVKARTNEMFGRPEEAIDTYKGQKLENIINRYLIEAKITRKYRLDVISIIIVGGQAIIRQIKNAELG